MSATPTGQLEMRSPIRLRPWLQRGGEAQHLPEEVVALVPHHPGADHGEALAWWPGEEQVQLSWADAGRLAQLVGVDLPQVCRHGLAGQVGTVGQAVRRVDVNGQPQVKACVEQAERRPPGTGEEVDGGRT